MNKHTQKNQPSQLPFLLFFSIEFLALSGLVLWLFLSMWIHNSNDGEVILDFNALGEEQIEKWAFPLFALMSLISLCILNKSIFQNQIHYSSKSKYGDRK